MTLNHVHPQRLPARELVARAHGLVAAWRLAKLYVEKEQARARREGRA